MSVRSSSIANDSLFLSSIPPTLPFGLQCLITEPQIWVFTVYTLINVLLLLPLFILVLYHGFQRRQRHSSTSHTDSFTYHLVTMEIIFVSGCIICFCGTYVKHFEMLYAGFYLFSFTWFGETFFHVLTCVDHYLAVVHPVTYLSLKKERGIRIRNVIIGCVWLLCFVGATLTVVENITQIVIFCLMSLCLIIIAFCCLSVLCVLVRPRPGGLGGDQEKADQSKRRAFCIILAILGVLLLRCAWSLVWGVLYELKSEITECVTMTGEVWFTLLSSLVLPLLFLQKIGLKRCLKTKIKK